MFAAIPEDQSPKNQRPGLETFRSKFGGSIFTSIAGHGHPEFSDTDDDESEAGDVSDVSASSDDESLRRARGSLSRPKATCGPRRMW